MLMTARNMQQILPCSDRIAFPLLYDHFRIFPILCDDCIVSGLFHRYRFLRKANDCVKHRASRVCYDGPEILDLPALMRGFAGKAISDRFRRYRWVSADFCYYWEVRRMWV